MAWTATRRSASVRGGFRRRRRSRRARAFCDRAPPGRRARTRLGLWACLLGGETPRAGVETRTERIHLRGGESGAERGEDGVVEESGADGDASLSRPRARGPREGLLAGERGGEGVDEERGRVLSLGLERAERGDGLGRVGDRSGEFLRRSRRRVAATPAKESREEREDQRGRGERNHPHPNVDGTTRARRGVRARTKTHEADARDAKKILVVRYVPGEKSSSGYLETNLARFSRRATRYDEPFPPSTPRSGTRIRAVDPAP